MSAKEKFIATHGQTWAKVIETAAFDSACDAVLLEFLAECPPPRAPGMPIDAIGAVNVEGQLAGARRTLAILKALHQPETKPKPRPIQRLNEAAGV